MKSKIGQDEKAQRAFVLRQAGSTRNKLFKTGKEEGLEDEGQEMGMPARSSFDKTGKISLIITVAGNVKQTVGSHLKTQEERSKTRGHNYAPLAALPSSS